MKLYLIYIILLTYPIATDLVLGIRLLDLILVVLVLIYILNSSKIRISNIAFISISIIFISANIFGSLLTGAYVTTEGFMLTAKLVLHVLCFYIIKKIFEDFTDIEIKRVFYLFLIVLLFIDAYCLISFFSDPSKQVGFMFLQGDRKDSHVLGSLLTLSILFVALNLKHKTNLNKFVLLFCILLTVMASLTTGSRSIIFILIVYVTLVSTRSFLVVNVKYFWFMSFIAGLAWLLYLLVGKDIDLSDIRSMQFSMQYASEAKRLARLLNVLSDLEQVYYAFGRGLLTVDTIYFDGTLTFMFYNFGILGAIIYLAVISYLSILFISKGYSHILFATLALISLLVTEFFLLARWYIPVVICYNLLYQNAKRARIKVK